jgi:hypothetical protein
MIPISSFSNVRPDLSITPKSHFICKSGKSLSGVIFKGYCRDNSKGSDTNLFILFNLDESILFDSRFIRRKSMMKLGSLSNWCSKELIDPETNAPQATNVECVLEFTGKKTKMKNSIPVNINEESGRLVKVNIDSLDIKETYYVTLKEISSEARSKTFLLKR